MGCWQFRHSAGGVDSPPSVGSCMRASRARSVDLHVGGVGARVVFHSAPIAFGMWQGFPCRMSLWLVRGWFSTAPQLLLMPLGSLCRMLLQGSCGMGNFGSPSKGDALAPLGDAISPLWGSCFPLGEVVSPRGCYLPLVGKLLPLGELASPRGCYLPPCGEAASP